MSGEELEAVSAEGTPGSAALVDRALAFVADVSRLIGERRAIEAEVAAEHASRLAGAKRAHQEAQQALSHWAATEHRQSIADLNGARRSATTDFDRETEATETAFAALQAEVTEEHAARTEAAKKAYDEAIWEAEALLNAQSSEEAKRVDEFNRQVEALQERLQAERSAATALLHGWGHPIPQIEQSTIPPVLSSKYAEQIQASLDAASSLRAQLAGLSLPYIASNGAWLFGYAALVIAGLAAGVAAQIDPRLLYAAGGVAFVLVVLGTFLVRSSARSSARELYIPFMQTAADTDALMSAALEAMAERTRKRRAALKSEYKEAKSRLKETRNDEVAAAVNRRDGRLERPTATYSKRLAELSTRRDRTLQEANDVYQRRQSLMRQRQDVEAPEIERANERRLNDIQAQHHRDLQGICDDWTAGLNYLQDRAKELIAHSTQDNGDAASIPTAVRFGEIRLGLDQFEGGVFQHEFLASGLPEGFTLPAVVPFPAQPSLFFKAHGAGRAAAIDCMRAVMLRLLRELPADKVRFTILDPVGLGDNFAAFMHLGDYNDAIITSRIWTESRHIEQQLSDLSENIENVIQQYLRNEYENIEQYNRRAGSIAEPYRFLVIANFPANFTEAAQRRLASIVHSGPRCGVYTFIMLDKKLPQPPAAYLRDLEQNSSKFFWNGDRFVWEDSRFAEYPLALDAPPPPAELTEALHALGQRATQASRVEVSFDAIAPDENDIWTSSAKKGVEVSLGVSGATRKQYLRLGKGTSQHVLVAGKTGSGKSTLLHALITNLALRFSPDEIEMYLVDFKQGVEFKAYANHQLPHARVVAIESDREFGVSVLNGLDAELKTRADRFRAAGAQDIASFRDAEPNARMPRIVLIVDEFQEFFVEDDKSSQDAALLLDRLIRQGRAFGIHVILGSQTLAGAYSLARSTIGQIAVRIALQCSEADAHLILSEDNTAARLLSRPGEAIYNDANGMIEGNQSFQVVWLPDWQRDELLDELRARYDRERRPATNMLVFEGNTPAEPARNHALTERLSQGRPVESPSATRAWIGEAVQIKDPTAPVFRRQSGSNLLFVGQNEELVLGMLSTALISIVAQSPRSTAAPIVHVFDGAAPDSRESVLLESLTNVSPDEMKLCRGRAVTAAVHELADEVERRQKEQGAAQSVFLVIYGLQKFRDLRRAEDDFGFSRGGTNQPVALGKRLEDILRDGPTVGVHTIVWCDNVNNLNRAWDRQTLRECEMRVALQMSNNDSSSLIDTPLANKLGMYRALYANEELALLEKFRPYSWPLPSWLAQVSQQLGK